MIDFRKLLKPETQRKIAEADEHYERDLIKFRNMTNKNLVATARYYMTQMHEPWKYEFGTPVYDAVFYHLIVPELFRRLEDGKAKSSPGNQEPANAGDSNETNSLGNS